VEVSGQLHVLFYSLKVSNFYVGLGAGLHNVEERKILPPTGNRTLAVQSVGITSEPSQLRNIWINDELKMISRYCIVVSCAVITKYIRITMMSNSTWKRICDKSFSLEYVFTIFVKRSLHIIISSLVKCSLLSALLNYIPI
jgi:hypothetical protein